MRTVKRKREVFGQKAKQNRRNRVWQISTLKTHYDYLSSPC